MGRNPERGSVRAAGLSPGQRLFRYFTWGLVHVVQRPKVCGPRPSPDAPTIYACRHLGLMDPVILMVVYFRQMIHPLVARDYVEKNRFTRAFYPFVGCIPIDRNNVSKKWLEDSLSVLEKGDSVIIFPEGRRNKSGEGLLPFRNGVAMLAARSGARVVPVYNAVWKFPHRYRLAIGEPVQLDPVPESGETAEWLNGQTQRIQAAVGGLSARVASC